ncbi:hypothetical protein [Paenibacillus assamensis]|uniref:hypothetical protein n=1 Tax=Paenibacillus assamensis TaxID=311244 RepID=UPI00048B283B|nr:hypothetical protein [Paenibacillus assamensis]
MKRSTILGVCLIALSGLEQILIYMINSKADSYEMLLQLTPEFIWSIPMITFLLGILLIVLPLIPYNNQNTADRKKK